VHENPSVAKEISEEEIPDRFIDEVREYRSDDAGEDPPPVMQQVSHQETKDNAGKEVEEE